MFGPKVVFGGRATERESVRGKLPLHGLSTLTYEG